MNYSNAMKAVLDQASNKGTFKKNEENGLSGKDRMKRMFNPMVDKSKGETEKIFSIRVIPEPNPDDTPFHEVLHHVIKIGGKFEKIVCPESIGKECIICSTEKILKADSDPDKVEASKKFRKSTFYIVRVLERGKEMEGVKFWRFKKSFQGKGEMDKIKSFILMNMNILDPSANGYDLHIVCGLNDKGYSTINNVLATEKSPLASTQERIDELINDPLKWIDIFPVKDDEYLTDVAAGRAKYWDKQLGKYVTPADPEAVNLSDPSTAESTTDFVAESIKNLKLEETTANIDDKLSSTSADDDDDLPF